MIEPADLRSLELLADVDDADLAELIEAGQDVTFVGDEVITRPGDPPDHFDVLLTGSMLASTPTGEPVTTMRAPTFMGGMGVMTGRPYAVALTAAEPSRMLRIPAAAFLAFARAHPDVERAVMQVVGPVVERTVTMTQRQEKLAALGTMSAGLAHELNNPAAAAQRSAEELARALATLNHTLEAFVESGVERAEAEQLTHLKRDAVAHAKAATPAGALDAADREDELADRLEGLVDDPWELVEPLAAAGVDAAWVDEVQRLAGPATEAALRWVASTITAESLAAELKESTERISALVKAIKEYTYMDRGERLEVDLHEGLESTLTILGHKLRHGSVEVDREYDRTLPRLQVYGSELNQVWTNLIDNAIDAIDGDGTLTLRTTRDGAEAVVEITDTGPGIPEEIRERIFDPFFTTKEPGRGTGLGLEAARRIVVERHGGQLRLEAGPDGRGTRAVVRLPLGT